MKNIIRFTEAAAIVAALTAAPALAQSSAGTQSPPSGTQSGQSQGGTSGSAGGAQGQQQRGGTAAKGSDERGLRGPDRAFLMEAMQGNTAEVELASLAQQKASGAAVREYAEMLQKDHSGANAKLKSLADGLGAAQNEPALTPKHTQLRDRLSKLEGAAFDKAYMAEMVKDHQQDVRKYEKASGQLQHAGLKSYATESLPVLKQHLERARKIASSPATN